MASKFGFGNAPKKKILVVEDNEDLLVVLKEALTDAGCEVVSAATGEDAVNRIQAENPQLVFLDFHLPTISGIDVLEQTKEYREKHPEMSVIMISNDGDTNNIHQAREYGIREYIVKADWRMEEIVAMAKKYL